MILHRQHRTTAELETILEAASNLTEISCAKRDPVRRGMPQLSGSQAGRAIRSSQVHISGTKRKDGKRSEKTLATTRPHQALHLYRRHWQMFRRRATVPYRNSWGLDRVHLVRATDSSYKKCQRRRKIERVVARKQRRDRLPMSRRLKRMPRCLSRQSEWSRQTLTLTLSTIQNIKRRVLVRHIHQRSKQKGQHEGTPSHQQREKRRLQHQIFLHQQ